MGFKEMARFNLDLLKIWLMEEASEVCKLNAGDPQILAELGDVLNVIQAIGFQEGYSLYKIETQAISKGITKNTELITVDRKRKNIINTFNELKAQRCSAIHEVELHMDIEQNVKVSHLIEIRDNGCKRCPICLICRSCKVLLAYYFKLVLQ